MADPNRNTRNTVNTTDRRRSGNSALWLILGGVLVALALYFFVFAGADVAEDAMVGPETTDESTVIVNEGAESTVEDAAGAVEGTAATVGETTESAAEAVEETTEDAVEGTAEAVDDAAEAVDGDQSNVTITTTAPGN